MNGSFLTQGNTLAVTLVAGALAPLFLIRLMPRGIAWALFGIMINLSLAAIAVRFTAHSPSALQLTAYFAAAVALLWSGCALAMSRTWVRALDGETQPPGDRDHLLAVSHISSMSGALSAAIIVVFMLTVRAVYWILELRNAAPLFVHRSFTFGGDGLWVIGVLILACLAQLAATGDRRLIAALYWLFVVTAVWGALLVPEYVRLPDGSYQRGAGAVVLLVGLSCCLCGFVLARSAWTERARWRAVIADPDELLSGFQEWPGLRQSAGVVGLLCVLLICFQFAAPTSIGSMGVKPASILTAACAAGSGAALFTLVGWRWSANLADIAMALVTLGVASLAMVLVPSKPIELGARFPMIFNGLMIALTAMSCFWVWISKVWRQQIDGEHMWTAAGRLAPLSERFAFFVACLALVMGSLMAIWPRLRPISHADDSLGRVSAAVAGHLFLVLTLLWSGRTTRRSSFSALAVMVILSLVGFVLIRSGPLRSTVEMAG